ncbi:hypothetical protein E2N92_08195 [Methanofollis formosanus]|uniref:Nucleic acid binding OB-fold tRNA/helicase-type n=1 Tax=Methanofollis formosanus TaxID=299308 RepID=A0A8G1EGY8_9EURY|nr:hypothetical protein [Methanofollis formosanus]QYZ79412.1 hypothetical protein E2N92_08195 [Methanofollis formosanus]
MVFDLPEKRALLILIGISALLMLVHLGLDHAGSAAFAAPWSPEAEDGAFVLLRGEVKNVRALSGGHLLAEVNGTRVFLPAAVAARVEVKEGAFMEVAGTVQTYQGKKEVVVGSASDLTLI